MSVVYYPAIIEKYNDESFGVFFPDLPGCTSSGSSITEAVINAEEALYGHILVSHEYGEKINEPTSIDKIKVEDDVNEVGRILVKSTVPGKKVRINITMDENLLNSINRVSNNRSGFLSDAAYEYLSKFDSI